MPALDSPNQTYSLPWLQDHAARIRRALADTHRKPLPRFLSEYILFSLRKRDRSRYISSLLYRRDVRHPYAYLGTREFNRLRQLVKQPALKRIFDDKLAFHRHFKNSGIRMPTYLGCFRHGSWQDKAGSVTELNTVTRFTQKVIMLLEKQGVALFAKYRNNYGGVGALKITTESDLEHLYEQFNRGVYIVQAVVPQHERLRTVFPYSLNTIRVITCMGKDRVARVACARIRFGQGRSIVDNVSSGGFSAGIDLSTGQVMTDGIQCQENGGEIYTHHPDTGQEICGLRIPMFQDVVAMALAAANHLTYPLIGWDIGISPDGPVLIEGNREPAFFSDEIASGPFMENPVLRPFLDELTGGREL